VYTKRNKEVTGVWFFAILFSLIVRQAHYRLKKEAKKSRLLKNSLKSTDYFTPQTRRAPWMPKFNNLFTHAGVCLAQGHRLK